MRRFSASVLVRTRGVSCWLSVLDDLKEVTALFWVAITAVEVGVEETSLCRAKALPLKTKTPQHSMNARMSHDIRGDLSSPARRILSKRAVIVPTVEDSPTSQPRQGRT